MIVVMSYGAFAQLSTGSSTSTNIRTGNRAQEGDFGIYFGTDLKIINLLKDPNVTPNFIPLVNLKYMMSDELELRIGIDLNKTTTNEKWEQKVEMDGKKKTIEGQYKEVKADNTILPGIAYHFSSNNILDVYAGAELPLGWERHNVKNKWDGDNGYSKINKTAFNVGLGGFIGLQAYVGNLPLAVGFEYGIYSRWDLNQKYKITSKANADSSETIMYTKELTDGESYDKLSVRKGEIGNQLRFTLTYFFNN